jgi:hypothetical protein
MAVRAHFREEEQSRRGRISPFVEAMVLSAVMAYPEILVRKKVFERQRTERENETSTPGLARRITQERIMRVRRKKASAAFALSRPDRSGTRVQASTPV